VVTYTHRGQTPDIDFGGNKMFYEIELVDNVPGCVIKPMEVEEVVIPEDWDI
jgi:hypothetical protein